MSSTASETERKYEVRPGRAVPRLDSLPRVAATAGPQTQELQAEYYDTDDLWLIRNGITLRRRRGGSDPGWHLKLPLDADTRREIRRPLGPVMARVQGHFAPVRAAAREAVLAALDSARYFALLDALDELLAAPPLATAGNASARAPPDREPAGHGHQHRTADRRQRDPVPADRLAVGRGGLPGLLRLAGQLASPVGQFLLHGLQLVFGLGRYLDRPLLG